MAPRKSAHRKVLFDSNIWRYVSDAGLEKRLFNRMTKTGSKVLIAPAVVYEALRIQDSSLRKRLTSLMVMPRWTRLMPEAYYESVEILSELRRVRPEVLYPVERPTIFGKLKQDWRRPEGGFWDRVRFKPELEAEHVGILEGNTLELARDQAAERRASFEHQGFRFEQVRIDAIKAKPAFDMPGWNGVESELWRFEGMAVLKRSILAEPHDGNAYWDWMSHALDLKRWVSSGPAYVRFWTEQVEASRMPRHWIRSCAELLMGTRKVSPGTPADAQLATYLVDADLFVSSDKVFVEVVNRMRLHSPVPMAEAVLVLPSPEFVDALLGTLVGTQS